MNFVLNPYSPLLGVVVILATPICNPIALQDAERKYERKTLASIKQQHNAHIADEEKATYPSNTHL